MVALLVRRLVDMRLLMLAALFSALGIAQVQAQSYAIMPGDTLRIEVLEDSSLDRTTLVLPDGTITFPMAGTLRVAGRSAASVRQALSSAIASDFASAPTVYVSVLSVNDKTLFQPVMDNIFVMGEVTSPGKIEAEPGTTLLQALAQSGTFTRFAALKRIELRRADPASGKEYTFLFNYKNGGGIPGSTVLKPGDVIVVPERRLFE